MLLLLPMAGAAEPAGTLVLPPGEDERVWRSAATLAGIGVGPCERRPCVELRTAPWVLVADDARVLAVRVPTGAADREEIAALAAGLLAELARPDPPMLSRPVAAALGLAPEPPRAAPTAPRPQARRPPQTPALARPRPVTTPTAPAAPPPVEARAQPPALPPAQPPAVPTAQRPVEAPAEPPAEPPAQPPPQPPAQPAPGPTPEPPAQPPTVAPAPVAEPEVIPRPPGRSARAARPWFDLRPAWSWRGGAATGGTGGIGGGLRVDTIELGARVAGSLPRRLDAADGTVAAGDLSAIARWLPAGPVAPFASVELGGSWRWFAADEPVDSFVVPIVGAELGVALTAGAVSVAPFAAARVDLVSTTIQRGDSAPDPLAPWELSAGLLLLLHIP